MYKLYRPSDNGGGGGGGGWGVHPNSEIRGGAVSKNIFSAFQASVWSKHKGSPPLDPPLICMARRSECGNQ